MSFRLLGAFQYSKLHNRGPLHLPPSSAKSQLISTIAMGSSRFLTMSKPYSPSALGLRGARVRRSPGTRRARLRPPAPVALGLRGHAAERAAAAIWGGVVAWSGAWFGCAARVRTWL